MVWGDIGYLLVFMVHPMDVQRVAGYKLAVVFRVVGHCLVMGALSRLFSVVAYI